MPANNSVSKSGLRDGPKRRRVALPSRLAIAGSAASVRAAWCLAAFSFWPQPDSTRLDDGEVSGHLLNYRRLLQELFDHTQHNPPRGFVWRANYDDAKVVGWRVVQRVAEVLIASDDTELVALRVIGDLLVCGRAKRDVPHIGRLMTITPDQIVGRSWKACVDQKLGHGGLRGEREVILLLNFVARERDTSPDVFCSDVEVLLDVVEAVAPSQGT